MIMWKMLCWPLRIHVCIDRVGIKIPYGPFPGAEVGFIDDVVAGERVVMKRTAKDLSYQALRLISIIRYM